MGFKCIPQVKGLVRSDGMRRDGKGQAKHRANAAAIINEAFLIADPNDGHPIPYRKSASETLDRTLTKDNKYTGYSTADDVMAAVEREAAAQTVEVRTTDKKTKETVIRQRSLRSDAVIAAAVIFNPPGAVACHWTPEQNDKFLQDSLDVMAHIQCSVRVDRKGGQKNDQKRSQQECHLFRRENIIATAEHRDEGEPEESEGIRTPNWHVVYKPEGEDGKYKGNLIDVYFLSHLCKEYPRLMRERGWDIDDCDLTDFTKFSDRTAPENDEYRAKRKAKIREGGKSVNKHRARANRKKAEARDKESQEMLDRIIELKQETDEYAERTRREADEARREKEQAEQTRKDAEQAAGEALEKKQIAEMGIQLLDDLRARRQEEIQELEKQRRKDIEEAGKARQQLEAVRAELGEAVPERDAARKEADELRKNKVALAEQAARETKTRIEAEARRRWEKWLKDKKAFAEKTAQGIIERAKAQAAELVAAAAEAATGEYAYFIKWMDAPHRKYTSGKYKDMTFLEAARYEYQEEIRKARVSQMPSSVRDARKGQRFQTGPDGPGP